MGCGSAFIHVLDATGMVIGMRGIEVDLQVADGFHDGTYLNSYLIGDTLVYDGKEEISDVYINASAASATYLITDIYNQSYWTPAIP